MANYNSFIFCGHGLSEVSGRYDPGATKGNIKENDLAKSICEAAKKYLKTTALLIHYDENNYEDRDLVGNNYTAKSGISIHINAGGGTGSEIYVPCREKYLEEDFKLVSEMSKLLAIPNRSVKSRDYNSENTYTRVNGQALSYTDYYKEIREAWSQGISLAILEVGFIDTSDLSKIQANIEGIGLLVAKYIAKLCDTEFCDTTIDKIPPTVESKLYYRVICGSFNNKENAIARVSELKKANFNSFIEAYNKI